MNIEELPYNQTKKQIITLGEYKMFSEGILLLQGLLDEWKIADLCKVITTDNAKNMVGIFNIPSFPTKYVRGSCINHVLQLCIKVFS